MPEYRKKLIEVALPLDAINKASIREKSIRHGHPSTLHLWWSRKPLATCRAVLFSSLVDDPSSRPEEFPTEQDQERERLRLYQLIERLITWENSNNQEILAQALAEIRKSALDNPPPLLDPFCGGGSIPLEAQRLGLNVYASDLNPVAVLITKALIEIPPKFAGRPPVNPMAQRTLLDREWRGAQGLADDIRYYGKWMIDEAERRIGHFYPKVTLPKEYGAGEATVIAWLWARAVTCPNPACRATMPLISKYWLSKTKSKQAWVEPVLNHDSRTVSFAVRTGVPSATLAKEIALGSCFVSNQGKKTKAMFKCIHCNIGIAKGDYIDEEANKGLMSVIPLATVVEGRNARIYLPVDDEQMQTILENSLQWLSNSTNSQKLPTQPARGTFASNAQGRIYGFKTFADYFTPRQLVALSTLSDLVQESREKVLSDASIAGIPADGAALNIGGMGANAYADAVATYLAFTISKLADLANQLCRWEPVAECPRQLFGRQGISMVWEFAEGNPFSESSGSWLVLLDNLMRSFQSPLMSYERSPMGHAKQLDATVIDNLLAHVIISTDPPYYDNVGYADLADFFYVWLRRSLGAMYPDLFKTMLVPKAAELVATPHRFDGSKSRAKEFFEIGLGKSFERMRAIQDPDYPLTVYYAFKQAESEADEEEETNRSVSIPMVIASTGWETMLEGLIKAGFTITGTWPIRTEMTNRNTGQGTNALASSIVLVCRPRPLDTPIASRRDFLNSLKRELPKALRDLQRGNIAPVDLAQAAIGPGMAIFSRYSKVLESDGTSMRVRTALQLINQTLDEVLSEQEGEYDASTRWAVAWFEQYGMEEGPYGVAETLSKAKNSAVGALVEAGILHAQGGKVRLLRRDEFTSIWNPATMKRLTAWEVTQRLIRALQEQGDTGAAAILDHAGAYS